MGAHSGIDRALERARHRVRQPPEKLPVTAYPAAAAAYIGAVAGREILVHHHVAQQPRASVAAFDQIVAEYAILGKAPAQGLLECIDIVDALADEGSFAKDILVNIRDRARVRIDPGVTTIQPRIERAVGARQTDRHTRLQDAIAGGDPTLPAVVAGAVQRVRHRPDELPCHIPRQLRIGIQGNDVSHRRQDCRVADNQRKIFGRPAPLPIAAQQDVEGFELAALALVAHPHPFLRIPQPRTVEEIEDIASALRLAPTVFQVQFLDPRAGPLHQRGIAGHRLLLRVEEIADQGEVQALILVGEKPHLQRLDQVLDALLAGKHGRNDHQGARMTGDAPPEVHPG